MKYWIMVDENNDLFYMGAAKSLAVVKENVIRRQMREWGESRKAVVEGLAYFSFCGFSSQVQAKAAMRAVKWYKRFEN